MYKVFYRGWEILPYFNSSCNWIGGFGHLFSPLPGGEGGRLDGFFS